MVRYTGRPGGRVPRYCCHRGHSDNGEDRCISFGAVPVDEAIGREVMRVVEPAAIEAAALAVTEDNRRQDRLVDALLLELKAARYAAERAWKQYDAVDPENRLVACELERRWNIALSRLGEVEQRVEREEKRAREKLPVDAETLRGLAGELEAAWSDVDADSRLKKRIVRTLIAEVLVDIDQDASEVEVVIHWQGGIHTILLRALAARGVFLQTPRVLPRVPGAANERHGRPPGSGGVA